MTDVKLDPGQANASKGAAAGRIVASSTTLPEDSRPSKQSDASAKTREANDKQVTQADSARISKEKQNQQKEKVQEAVTKLNDYIQSVQRDLEFNLDEDSGKVVVKVVDRNTNETIRQIPDEAALKLARNLQTEEPISLLNEKA